MWTWIDVSGTAGQAGPPGASSPSCVDFVINSQSDLDAIAPGTGSAPVVHNLPSDGVYCFGAFTLSSQHQIVVPGSRKVELRGHGTSSFVQGIVDNGAILLFQANAIVHAHDFKVNNTTATTTGRSVESATTDAYVHDFAAICNSGEGIRVTGGRFFASQLRISNCLSGIACRGGEVFLVNYDCESVGSGISIDAAHGGLQWLGGRCASLGTGVLINADCESLLLQGITNVSVTDFVKRNAGIVARASIIGNTTAVTTNAINWSSANTPTQGLCILGNTFNVGNALVGLDQTAARVNAQGNFQSTSPNAIKETEVMRTFFSTALTPAAIAARTNANTQVNIAAAKLNDVVTASPRSALQAGLKFNYARVSANGIVQLNLANYTAGSITPTTLTWDFCLTRT